MLDPSLSPMTGNCERAELTMRCSRCGYGPGDETEKGHEDEQQREHGQETRSR